MNAAASRQAAGGVTSQSGRVAGRGDMIVMAGAGRVSLREHICCACKGHGPNVSSMNETNNAIRSSDLRAKMTVAITKCTAAKTISMVT